MRTSRNPFLPSVIALSVLAVAGLLAVALSWRGLAATLVVYVQVPYAASGALGGIAVLGFALALLAVQAGRKARAREHARVRTPRRRVRRPPRHGQDRAVTRRRQWATAIAATLVLFVAAPAGAQVQPPPVPAPPPETAPVFQVIAPVASPICRQRGSRDRDRSRSRRGSARHAPPDQPAQHHRPGVRTLRRGADPDRSPAVCCRLGRAVRLRLRRRQHGRRAAPRRGETGRAGRRGDRARAEHGAAAGQHRRPGRARRRGTPVHADRRPRGTAGRPRPTRPASRRPQRR